jgi:hypothetical protein
MKERGKRKFEAEGCLRWRLRKVREEVGKGREVAPEGKKGGGGVGGK